MYIFFLLPKKTPTIYSVFQGHQNISSGILDSYKYHILSKNGDYFFSKNHSGLFIHCIFWSSSKCPLNSIFTKRTTYYAVTICTSKFKWDSDLSTRIHLNITQWFGFQGDISWKFLLYKEAGSHLCTLGLKKTKISMTSWNRKCLSLRIWKILTVWLIDLIITGYIQETVIKPHP